MNIPASSFTAMGVQVGASTADVTPLRPVFLFGYPHVPRISTGVHDPLECAALYVAGGGGAALFLALDLVFVPRELVANVRRRIAAATGIAAEAILVSATHTHSGPNTVAQVSNAADPVVAAPDPDYLITLADRIVEAAVRAVRSAAPAEIAVVSAQVDGVGTNRHDPHGPADPEVTVLVARERVSHRAVGALLVYAMHPTVLHEDSTLISADFPHFTRQFLRRTVLPENCPVLYHNGASGDQSPRHVTRGNTFAEAQRIGERLGEAAARAMAAVTYETEIPVRIRRGWIDLAARKFPPAGQAEQALVRARSRHAALRAAGAPAPVVRTAECDVFGAEESVELARAGSDGRLALAVAARTPAEIQVIRLGGWSFVAWPGEFFIEYALAVKAAVPRTAVITLANGELQGYIVSPAAAERGDYEANNAVFAPDNGDRFVAATLALLGEW